MDYGIDNIEKFNRTITLVNDECRDLQLINAHIKERFEQLSSYYEGVDISFLYLKYSEQIEEIDKINEHFEHSGIVLSNILKLYMSKENEIVFNANYTHQKLNDKEE